MPSP
ncbi:hypothetical protein D4764_0242920 [Takifugu flavidus]|jgi:hypothetical protein